MPAVLTLLSLLLAFTFGMANARFDARRQAVLDEVNGISTVWLRLRLLASADAEDVRRDRPRGRTPSSRASSAGAA